jgi:alpha-beta hydrolase superfamily lysophospholipase
VNQHPAVRHTSSQFDGAGGALLHLQAWLPAGEPAAVLAVVHGYGDHGGRYVWFGEAMAARGYALYVYDLRGHGQSSGERGQVRRFSDYHDDTAIYLDEVRRSQPGRPVYLLGHSLGGLIAAGFAAEHPQGLDGLVLSSPFFRLAMEVPPSKVVGAKVLSVVKPGWNIGNMLQAADLSHEPEVVDAYVTDPLVHHVAPARWAVQMLSAQAAAPTTAERLELPLLLLYGDEDVVADPAVARAFFAAAGSPDKTLHCYEGFYHELFNETERARVFEDLAAWLAPRLAPPPSPAGPT